jgi:hypothetical protein
MLGLLPRRNPDCTIAGTPALPRSPDCTIAATPVPQRQLRGAIVQSGTDPALRSRFVIAG